jgi:hypothetical protein
VKLTIHFYIAPRSRIRGAIPPLPNTPSWRGAYLKHRDNFTFTRFIPIANTFKDGCEGGGGLKVTKIVLVPDLISVSIERLTIS